MQLGKVPIAIPTPRQLPVAATTLGVLVTGKTTQAKLEALHRAGAADGYRP